MLLSPKSTLAYVSGQPDWLMPYLIMANLALVPAIFAFFIGLFRLQVTSLISSVMVFILTLVVWGVKAEVIWLLGRIFGGKAHRTSRIGVTTGLMKKKRDDYRVIL